MTKTTENINSIKAGHLTTYCDNRIGFIENLKNDDGIEIIKLNVTLVILCLRGQSSLFINGELFHINANDLLICQPNVTLEKSNMSLDAEFRGFTFSKEYMQQLVFISDSDPWDTISFLEKSPILHLEPEETVSFCQYYDLIRSKLIDRPRRHQKELVDALLQAFLYDFRDLLDRFNTLKPQTYTAGEKVFHNFVKLLKEVYPKPRNVNFYADKLCITPKYLSSICKKISGYTASNFINRYVIKDIQILLKRSDKTIKEICNELDFPNLSFFGRFVKKHLGASPKQWRKQNIVK